MNISKAFSILVLSGALTFSMVSCKSKVSDTDLKAKVETVVSANPNVLVSVKDGVVTLTGNVGSEDEKLRLVDAAKNADGKHIKSVVDELQIAAPVITVNSNDADLITKVIDATKDFPTVKTDIKDGVIFVTGTLEQARIQTLKMGLDALNPKKVDMSGLTVK